jgi:hypothetical protein
MGSVRRSTFRAALIAAGIIFAAGGVACQSVDAAALADGMKAKMKLPFQIDDDTRLDDVRAISKKELGYFMTLTKMTKAQADANGAFANLLESNLRGGACQNQNYMKIFKAGISLRMTYASQDQVEIKKIVLVPKDCGL